MAKIAVQSRVERASVPALGGWVLFDWAAQPFYTLITTFLFAPYFASGFIGDSVRGQALWGYAAAVAGLLVAFSSPVVGAVVDGTGRRKVWIAGFSVVFCLAMSVFWFAEPGASDRIWIILGAFVVATLMAELTTVLTNSMMVTLVPASEIGRLSGIGWAMGYVGGLVSLVVMAGLIIADPVSGKTLLGLEPMLNLDANMREGDRLVGPFSALWYLLFVLPFFFFTPQNLDTRNVRSTLREGLEGLWSTLKSVRQYENIFLFLLARLFYVDGLSAIFVFGGIYGASVFGWQAFQLGLFGIILTIAGVVGAIIGGVLDDKFGAKRVISVSLVGLIIATVGIVSIDRSNVLFFFDVAEPLSGRAPLSSTGEMVYLGFGCLIGLVAGPLQSASRSLLARLAPREKITQFFGLFAFSGKVTAFMAPLAVALITSISGSQRFGVATILVFLVVGLLILNRVSNGTK